MPDVGACGKCGRPRTPNAAGTFVSCCPRAVRAPRRAHDAATLLEDLAERVDRTLAALPSLLGPRALLLLAAAGYVLLVAAAVLRWENYGGANATAAPPCVRGSPAPSARPR